MNDAVAFAMHRPPQLLLKLSLLDSEHSLELLEIPLDGGLRIDFEILSKVFELFLWIDLTTRAMVGCSCE